MTIRKIKTIAESDTLAAIYRDSDTGEYIVRLTIGSVRIDDADYFTDDKLDAIGTAYAMVVKAIA